MDNTYIYDGTPLPAEGLSPIRRAQTTSPVTDDLRAVTIANLIDGIHAAWNGWEQACKFEDDGLQAYYLKYVTILSSTLEKIKRL